MKNDNSQAERLRRLPPVDALVAAAAEAAREREVPRDLLLAYVREALEEARLAIRGVSRDGASGGDQAGDTEQQRAEAIIEAHDGHAGGPASGRDSDNPRGVSILETAARDGRTTRDAWVTLLTSRVMERIDDRSRGLLRRVVNATGVLLHTNLGRAPLAARAQARLFDACAGYSSLELDLGSGRRRSRLEAIRRLIPAVTGAEAGMAVHNNAAAVYLALTALAGGREVLVSRGHLVEIGGSFRLPDIMAASGARLVEVGSTNRTRLSDYERGRSRETALVLKVHPSNFRMVGFTEEVSTKDLAAWAESHGLPLLHDVGSGALRQHGRLAFDEPLVQDSLEAGAHLVCFSGDKLLGGPQAGILAGRRELVEGLARHPVARVVRLDKSLLAALEATLEIYLDAPAELPRRIPLLGLLDRGREDVAEMAEALARALREALGEGWAMDIVETTGEVGGGSLPGVSLASKAVGLKHPDWTVDQIARALRRSDPPVVGRIERDRFLLDVRALLPGDETLVARGAKILLSAPDGA